MGTNKLVVANWKSYPVSLKSALRLARDGDRRGVVVCPPYTLLLEVGRALAYATLGAQDVSHLPPGAATGEVSVAALRAVGVRYVILGHSERRALGETSERIREKVRAALAGGLRVVLCLGESAELRSRGRRSVEDYLARELDACLGGEAPSSLAKLVLAYEPVWAISANEGSESCSPEVAEEAAETLRAHARGRYGVRRIKVLYGGSVSARTARGYLEREGLDGLLIGSASARSAEWRKVLRVLPLVWRNIEKPPPSAVDSGESDGCAELLRK